MNTLTNLIPDLYAALNVVSRELVGFIPAVGADMRNTPAAKDETIRIPIAGTANVSDVSPSMSISEPTDQTVTNTTVTISKSRVAEFGFTGEEQKGLNNGVGYISIQAQMIAQAMRSLVNEVENDIADLYYKASRAYGTGGTTPFSSNLGDSAQVRKIIEDNGGWINGNMNLVIDSTAAANLRTLTQLTKANEADSADTLRRGVLLDLHGFALRSSAQIASHTKGTASGATTDASGYSEGDTTITLASAGTGTILAGDVITFAGDSNKYLVTSGDSDVSNGGTITIAAPGLKQDIAASATAITVQNSYTANMAFERSAIQLVTRVPAKPQEGDARIDNMIITDPASGLSFEVSVWAGNRKVRYELGLAWGVALIKPEHTAILLG